MGVATLALATAGRLSEISLPDLLAPAQPDRISADAFQALADRVSNWGHYGDDDLLGTLNEITPDKIRRASRLVQEGITVNCGTPNQLPSTDTRDAGSPMRTTIKLRIDASDEWGAVNDHISTEIHGRGALTHLDALGHIYHKGRHYNGVPFRGVVANYISPHGVETARKGIVSRGVLLDLAAAMGKPWLEAGDRVTPDGLRKAIADTGTTLEPGDILIFNTGANRLKASNSMPGQGTGGMQIECAEILFDARPALVISDAGVDAMPSEVESQLIPWHVLFIVYMGVRMIDSADLTNLISTCNQLNRSTFLCTIAPLVLTGNSGSPVNPVCVF